MNEAYGSLWKWPTPGNLSFLLWKFLFSKHISFSGNVPVVPYVASDRECGFVPERETAPKEVPSPLTKWISMCCRRTIGAFPNGGGNLVDGNPLCFLPLAPLSHLLFVRLIPKLGGGLALKLLLPVPPSLSPWPSSRKPLCEVCAWNNFSTLVFVFR